MYIQEEAAAGSGFKGAWLRNKRLRQDNQSPELKIVNFLFPLFIILIKMISEL